MNVILHIPHASTSIPNDFRVDYTDFTHAEECANVIADHGTCELADYVSSKSEVIRVDFPFSRVFCDVERFDSDEEEMNSVGMGVLYTHSHTGREIRIPSNPDSIKRYYYEHHEKLNKECVTVIEKNGSVLFVDIHSFSDEALPYELHKDLKRPDICIGVEEYHLSKKDIDILINTIEEYGYTVAVNQPFIGCLIPGDYYLKDERVRGFMFEMNKRLLPELEKVGSLLLKIIENIR